VLPDAMGELPDAVGEDQPPPAPAPVVINVQ
jgi:hypothetical protein